MVEAWGNSLSVGCNDEPLQIKGHNSPSEAFYSRFHTGDQWPVGGHCVDIVHSVAHINRTIAHPYFAKWLLSWHQHFVWQPQDNCVSQSTFIITESPAARACKIYKIKFKKWRETSCAKQRQYWNVCISLHRTDMTALLSIMRILQYIFAF